MYHQVDSSCAAKVNGIQLNHACPVKNQMPTIDPHQHRIDRPIDNRPPSGQATATGHRPMYHKARDIASAGRRSGRCQRWMYASTSMQRVPTV